MTSKQKYFYQGQGLLEVIVAIGVITTGLVSALGLTVANLATTQTSAMRIVAANLAREGIEVVRNIRDNNWLTKKDYWDEGLKCDDHTGAVEPDAAAINCEPNSWADEGIKLRRTPDGFFNHKDGEETGYQRLITLDDICADATQQNCGDDRICEAGEESCKEKIGIRVRSQVQWLERGSLHSLTAEERLYNWY